MCHRALRHFILFSLVLATVSQAAVAQVQKQEPDSLLLPAVQKLLPAVQKMRLSRIVANAAAQKQLGVTAEQKKAIDALLADNRKAQAELKELKGKARREKRTAMLQTNAKRMATIFNKEQLTQLRSMQLRRLAQSLADEEGRQALKLTEEQAKQLNALAKGDATLTKIEKILDEQQTKILKKTIEVGILLPDILT